MRRLFDALLGACLLAHVAANALVRARALANGEWLALPGGSDPVRSWCTDSLAIGITGALLLLGHRWAARFGAGALALIAVGIAADHVLSPRYNHVVGSLPGLAGWLPWTFEAAVAAALAVLLWARARREGHALDGKLPADAEPVTTRHVVAAGLVGVFFVIVTAQLLFVPWNTRVPPGEHPLVGVAVAVLQGAVSALVLWSLWTALRRGSPLARGVVAGVLIWDPSYRLFALVTGVPWLDASARDVLGVNAAVGLPFLLLGIALCLPRWRRPTMVAAAR